MAKKLLINKSDTVEHIIELIESTKDNDLALVVPRAARLRESREQLQALREAVEQMGKTITIESIDEELLALAHAAHLPAAHPFFHSDRRNHGMSDIVRPDEPAPEDTPPSRKVPVRVHKEEEKTTSIPVVVEPSIDAADRANANDDTRYRTSERSRSSSRSSRSRRAPLIAVIVVLVVLGGGAIAMAALSHPNVDMQLHEVPWTYDGTVTVSTGAATSTSAGATIPGQLFESRKNATQGFPATGAAPGTGSFAQGTIKVWNAFDTNPQELVVKTRFVTSDGKLYRLTKGITVPAATKDASGKIVPTSIDAPVTADQAGESYNTSDTTLKLTIPGFEGKPQHDGFYGTMVSVSGGGATGAKVTSDGDVDHAKSQITTLLENSFRAAVLASVKGKELTVIDGASSVSVDNITVDRTLDSAGNFNVFVDAHLQALAFREADLKSLLLGIAAGQQAANGPQPAAWDFRTVTLSYSDVKPSLSSGSMQMNVHVEGVIVPAVDAQEIAASVAGKKNGEAAATLKALPGVDEVSVSGGALWNRSLPVEPTAIAVTVH